MSRCLHVHHKYRSLCVLLVLLLQWNDIAWRITCELKKKLKQRSSESPVTNDGRRQRWDIFAKLNTTQDPIKSRTSKRHIRKIHMVSMLAVVWNFTFYNSTDRRLVVVVVMVWMSSMFWYWYIKMMIGGKEVGLKNDSVDVFFFASKCIWLKGKKIYSIVKLIKNIPWKFQVITLNAFFSKYLFDFVYKIVKVVLNRTRFVTTLFKDN